MKNSIVIFLMAILLASCGSNKGFHKKHHGHRKWVKVEQNKVQKNLATVDQEEDKVDPKVETVDKTASNEVVSENIEKTIPSSTEELSTVSSTQNVSKTVSSETEKPNKVKRRARSPLASKRLIKKHIKSNIDAKEKTNDGGLGQLILLALLIVLIIIVFSILDGLLGGLLGLFLLVLLILLLLRYFGVI